jgi:hypothetical protein
MIPFGREEDGLKIYKGIYGDRDFQLIFLGAGSTGSRRRM